jgi:hypothetical protein
MWLVPAGRDVMREPLEARRVLLERKVPPKLAELVRYVAALDADLPTLIASVRRGSRARRQAPQPRVRAGPAVRRKGRKCV